ncbi:hypothetical protein J1N35_038013 [Gossypium stocksii]|uniref:Uncharacterized protein n=1 Tax=Gossypium stocksii TaxID=47602 RepID=A0A9D3ULU3_9ROSI|nr:hypothetical protein J1N35_038013 [Gossypium stocksii]
MECVRQRCGYCNRIDVSIEDTIGRLGLRWKKGSKESCEEKIRDLWKNSNLCVPEHLKMMGKSLMNWMGKLRRMKVEKIKEHEKRMEDLKEGERTYIILGEIIETKLELNMEIDKTKLY